MPRETVRPEHHADDDRTARAPGTEGFLPMPTLSVTFDRGIPGVGIGLETPAWRGLVTDGSSGQHSVLDWLYGTAQLGTDDEHPDARERLAQIGDELVNQLRVAGWKIEHDEAAMTGRPASSPALGRMALNAVSSGVTDPHGFTGWFTWLDRAGVNRAIQVLRKAGAAAWGKDEW